MFLNKLSRSFPSLLLSSRRCKWTSRTPLKVLDDEGKEFYQPHIQPIEEPKEVTSKPSSKRPKKSPPKKKIKTAANYSFIDSVISITSRKTKKNKDGLVMLEGSRLIEDAFLSGANIQTIYYSDQNRIEDHPFLARFEQVKIPIVRVSHEDYKVVSQQVTPSGFMAICKRPTPEDIESNQKSVNSSLVPLTVIADNFRDPGNLGCLLRSTAAVGATKVICSKGCVHVWDPKVMRSGSGAHFRIPVFGEIDWEDIHNQLKEDEAQLYFAESSNNGESTYHRTDYFSNGSGKVAIMVGCEAEGFKDGAKWLIEEMAAQKISIPLSRGVESLNNQVAAAVIMFEIRRQFDSRQ